jgi:probable rRNA maturation factor
MSDQADEPLLIDFTVSDRFDDLDVVNVRCLLNYAARQEDLSGELGIWLCTDDEIAELHQRFMNISGATDVITFAGEAESGGYLGDIAVSVDTAKIQARDAQHSTLREISYLCLHGLLHIAGYDDIDECSRWTMFARQDALMTEFERTSGDVW